MIFVRHRVRHLSLSIFLFRYVIFFFFFFFSSRRRHTILTCDWSSDVCSSDLSRRQFLKAADGDRMRQSRAMSLIESLANVAIGYGIAVLTQLAVFPLFGLSASLAQNMMMGLRSEERRVGKDGMAR